MMNNQNDQNSQNGYSPFQPGQEMFPQRQFPAASWQQDGTSQPFAPSPIVPDNPAGSSMDFGSQQFRNQQALSPNPNSRQTPGQPFAQYVFPPEPIMLTPPVQPRLSNPASRKQNKKLIFTSVIVCIVLALSAGGYLFWKAANALPDVTLYQVNNQNVTQYVGGGGIVYPKQQIDISYPVVERVVSVFVKPGDHVTPNEPLIQLDPGQLNAQIQEASNEVAAAQAYLNSISANANPVTLAQAQHDYSVAKAKYDSLVAESSSYALHNGNLISPMNGVVTAVNVNADEVFAADTPLITVMDESTMIVHVEVPLINLGQVQSGQPATVTPSALPDLNMNGTVSAIIPQANSQTDTFEIWVSVPNPKDMLLPGMSAYAHIQQAGQAIAVPRLAVLNPDRESIVFVVRGEYAYIQPVQIEGRSTAAFFVKAGLSSGDKVVLLGIDTLQNGQEVHVAWVENQTSH